MNFERTCERFFCRQNPSFAWAEVGRIGSTFNRRFFIRNAANISVIVIVNNDIRCCWLSNWSVGNVCCNSCFLGYFWRSFYCRFFPGKWKFILTAWSCVVHHPKVHHPHHLITLWNHTKSITFQMKIFFVWKLMFLVSFHRVIRLI